MNPTHEALLRVVRYLPEDFYPYGQNVDREGDLDVDLTQVSDQEVAAYFE